MIAYHSPLTLLYHLSPPPPPETSIPLPPVPPGMSTPLPPPPPPPPPPPMTIFNENFKKEKLVKNVVNRSEDQISKTKTSIDLKEILQKRSQLKPTSISTTKKPKQMESILKEALNRIRNVVPDSDASEDEDSEQDFE